MAGTDKFITVNGVKLHYVEHGDPSHPPFLCLHGIGNHGHSWDTLASQISDRYHVLALTARGHGDSDRTESYEGQKFVDDTAAFMEATGSAPAIVCGLSMGGQIGLGLAALHADKVAKLIDVDAGPPAPQPSEYRKLLTEAIAAASAGWDTTEEAMAAWRIALPGVADEEVRSLVEHGTVRTDDGKLHNKTDPSLFQSLLSPESGSDDNNADDAGNVLWAACAMIKCPTLIVRGSRSTAFARETAERMLATIPNAKLVEVDSEHVVPNENPVGFYEAIKDFI